MGAIEDHRITIKVAGNETDAASVIVDNLDIWTSAIKNKSSAGRGSGSKRELYGIKKLRELILALAVRGLLVPQDPNDEPASELLMKLDAEKTRFVKEGKIKKQKRLPAVSDEEKPFDVPRGWELERVGNLVSKLGSGSTPRGGKNAYVEKGIPFLRSQNVWNDGLKLDDIAYISIETHKKMDNTKVFPGDVLLNITGASLGRSTIFPDELVEANVSQHVTIIRLLVPEMARFFHLGILSPMIQKLVWGRQVGMAIEGLSKKVLEMFEFPIPPVEEQHRIVAKVDELMALCDQLEQQTEASLTAHETLVEALLGALTNAADHDSFQQAWQRIAQHFDTLFTTEHSIDQLKQTILQLAVMGKLVPQDPNEEPANELLKRIAAEKARLIREGKIKKQKSLPPVNDENVFFDLPTGWSYGYIPEVTANKKYAIKRGPFGSAIRKDFFVPYGYKVYEQQHAIRDDFSLGHYYVTEMKFLELQAFEVNPNDIIISCSGTVGKVAIAPPDMEPGIINQALLKLTLNEDALTNKYFKILFPAFYMRTKTLSDLQGTAQKNMVSVDTLKKEPFPLPPVAEQHRIVAKVDELMALCDQLKARLNEAQTTQLHLADALTEQAIA